MRISVCHVCAHVCATGYLLLGTVNQLVLVGALIAGTHSLVLPQSLGMLIEFLKENPGKNVG